MRYVTPLKKQLKVKNIEKIWFRLNQFFTQKRLKSII